MKFTEINSEGDFEIEGVIVNVLYGKLNPEHKKPTGDELGGAMKNAITKCRLLEMSEEEIEQSIRLNLRTYDYADKTFPVKEWME